MCLYLECLFYPVSSLVYSKGPGHMTKAPCCSRPQSQSVSHTKPGSHRKATTCALYGRSSALSPPLQPPRHHLWCLGSSAPPFLLCVTSSFSSLCLTSLQRPLGTQQAGCPQPSLIPEKSEATPPAPLRAPAHALFYRSNHN